jgi:hypothetical protein
MGEKERRIEGNKEIKDEELTNEKETKRQTTAEGFERRTSNILIS